MVPFPGRERFFSRLTAARRRAAFWIDVVSVVRPNGLLLLAAVGASLWVLGKDTRAVSAFFDRSTFFSLIAALLGAIALFYVAAVIAPYLWFLLTYYVLRRNRNQILFTFPRDTCALGETFDIDAILQRKMRLLFGAITFRLVFWNYDTTDWYFLLRNQTRKGQLFNSADRGAIASFSMQFRHLGRFRTRYSVVKFEDPLGLFSLPIVEKEYHPTDKDKNFFIYSLPVAPRDGAAPWYRKRTTVPGPSDRKFRVAEDFFDHKRYEPADDSRRILWQVYARTGELLVRIPERDPVIDADLDLYAIFYNSYLSGDSERFRRSYDAYVTAIGRFIESLRRQRALNIRLVTDCVADPPYEDDPTLSRDENLRRALVSTLWHRQKTPARFFADIAAQRSPDRERILLVHPQVRAEDIPAGELGLFSGAWLLAADGGPEATATVRAANLLYTPERGLLRSWSGALLARPFERHLRVNRMRLARLFTEADH